MKKKQRSIRGHDPVEAMAHPENWKIFVVAVVGVRDYGTGRNIAAMMLKAKGCTRQHAIGCALEEFKKLNPNHCVDTHLCTEI